MALPLLPILVVGALGLAAASQSKPKPVDPNRAAREQFLATCPLDPNLSPDQQQAVRVMLAAALIGQKSPAELNDYAMQMQASGHPLAAVCLASFAASLQAYPPVR